MLKNKANRQVMFYRLVAVAFFLFVFCAYKLKNYEEILLSPSGLFNHAFGSFLTGFFILGLIISFVAIVVFFYFILHEVDA